MKRLGNKLNDLPMVAQLEQGQKRTSTQSSRSDSKAYCFNLFTSLTVVWKLDSI